MKHMMRYVVVIVAIGLLSLLSVAQDDVTTAFEFESSDATIMFPDDWVQAETEDGVLTLTGDGVSVTAYDFATLDSVFDVRDVDSPEALLTSVIAELSVSEDVELDADNIKIVELDDREVARIAFETGESIGSIVAVSMGDESLGLVMFTMSSDDFDTLSPIIDELVASFDVEDASSTGGSCFISTDQARTVRVRVGYGENRTSVTMLASNVDFEVKGQNADDNDLVWYALDKEEAAPGKSITGDVAWVAGNEVDAEGDCNAVPTIDASGIIPIRQDPPTPAPSDDTEVTEEDTGTDTTTETVDQPVVDASGAFIPSQGDWFESRGNGNVRCDGFSSAASPVTGSFTATLSGGGSNGIVFDGRFYAYLGNNTYETTYIVQTQRGDAPLRETFTLTSENTGEGSIGGVFGPCTFFLPFTLNYVGG